jgi:hypothetical protein
MEPKEDCKGVFTFVSRHKPNNGQLAMIYNEELGQKYCDVKQVDVVFGKNPVENLKENEVSDRKIGIVAPTYVKAELLNRGYELVEFVNEPSRRQRGVFVCKGAYTMDIDRTHLEELTLKNVRT